MPGLPDTTVDTAAKRAGRVRAAPPRGRTTGTRVGLGRRPRRADGKSWKLLDAGATGDRRPGRGAPAALPASATRRATAAAALRRPHPDHERARRSRRRARSRRWRSRTRRPGSLPTDTRPASSEREGRPIRCARSSRPRTHRTGRARLATSQVEASRFLLLDLAEFLARPARLVRERLVDAAHRAPPTSRSGTRSRRARSPARHDELAATALTTAWHERLILFGDAEGASSLNLNLRKPGLTPDQLDAARRRRAAAAPERRIPTRVGRPRSRATSWRRLPSRSSTRAATSRYVLRCVYQRPECGPLHPDVVSDALATRSRSRRSSTSTRRRARSTIALPVDTSIATCASCSKNVSFLISDELRAQMKRVTDLQEGARRRASRPARASTSA